MTSEGRGWVLLAVSFGWLMTLGVRLVFPPLVPFLVDAFDVSLADAGLVLTLLWFAYAVGQLPGGFLGDSIGERKILTASMAVTIAALLVTVATPYPVLLVGIAVLGLGTGLYATARFTILSEIYPETDGTAIGISASIGHVGSVLLPPIAVFLTISYGWRVGVGFTLPLAAVAMVGLWVALPESSANEADHSRQSVRTVLAATRRDLGTRPIVAIAVLMFLLSFIEQGLMAFYPTYLVTEKGIDETTASALFGLFFASAIFTQPLAGVCSDRIGASKTITGVIVVTAVSIFAFRFVDAFVVILVVTAGMGILFGFWPVAYSNLMAELGETNRNTGIGVVRTCYLMLASTSPVILGSLADRGYFDEAFTALAVLAAVAVLVNIAVNRSPSDA